MSRPYSAPAIRRAVDVLTYLANRPDPVRLSEIARDLECGKSSMHGILRSLEDVGWVVKDESSAGFRVGEALRNLARKAFGERDVLEVARPLVRKLAEKVGESAFLGFLKGDRVVIDESAEGGGEMCITSRSGGSIPMWAGATAKVFLSGMPDDEVWALLESTTMPRYTEKTVTDPRRFLEEVRRTRTLGYGYDDEEYLRGVRAVAVPLRRDGAVVAAMWVAGFASGLPGPKLIEIREALLEVSSVCSAALDS